LLLFDEEPDVRPPGTDRERAKSSGTRRPQELAIELEADLARIQASTRERVRVRSEPDSDSGDESMI
jgi:hypothetical protein